MREGKSIYILHVQAFNFTLNVFFRVLWRVCVGVIRNIHFEIGNKYIDVNE